jgi:FkbM family methyltransferase
MKRGNNMGTFKYQGPMRFELDLYPNFIQQRTRIQPTNVFEIGANIGDDAEYLRQCFDIHPANVFCIEANPTTFEELKKRHPDFNSINVAVSDKNEQTTFRCSKSENMSSGFNKKNSIPEWDYVNVTVDVIRMDYLIEQYGIKEIDVCKIDVEGFTWEVLQGFGNKLSIVKSFQLENERGPVFGQTKMFMDTCKFLCANGFTLLNYIDWGAQCDSLWIRNDMISYQTFKHGCDFI